MGKVFDDEAVAQAFRDAAEALRRGDPDTLAGRFVRPPARREAPEARVASSVAKRTARA